MQKTYIYNTNNERLNSIGSAVRYMRVLRKWTQSELAQKCGVCTKTISLIECGRRGVSWPTLQKLLTELHFRVDFCPEENLKNNHTELRRMLQCIIPRLQTLLDLCEKDQAVNLNGKIRKDTGSSQK